jgi:hypothetical protein
MQTPETDPSEEVSQWLQEVGRRKWPGTCAAAIAACQPATSASPPRLALLLALFLVAALQYLYADTSVEILSLRSLLVFVPH